MSVYACTDLHGRKDLYMKIKSELKQDDKVFFLGDANDRGPDGWELIQLIYHDPQFCYIKGNHEDMLVKAAMKYLKTNREGREARLLFNNGGLVTFNSWIMDGCNAEMLENLDQLPTHAEYENENGTIVLMSHAGYTPWFDEDNPGKIIIPDDEELIWNRDHFYEDWDYENFNHHLVIHGHTPIPHLANRLLDKAIDARCGAYWYEGNKKVCLDNLSAFSDRVCLLNLDTFKETMIIK